VREYLASQEDETILPIAQLIDQHLKTHWVTDATKQKRPQPTILTATPVKAKSGSVFTIQLNNVTDTYELKTGEDIGIHIAVLTENGSKDGKFNFLAVKPGKSKVVVRVADHKTFAIAEVEAAIEIS
jgi:hypothetical protein